MKICAIGDPHGDLDKIKNIFLRDVDLIFITGDLGKANLARQRHFENLKREKRGLEPLEEDKEFVSHLYMQVHKSTLDLLKYCSKSAPTYFIEGNVNISGLKETQERNDTYGLKLKSTLEEIKKIKNASIVKNRLRILNGLRVGFLEYFVDTFWVREFKPSDYKEKLKIAKEESDKAKRILNRWEKVDVLVCHQPPYGILDKVGSKYNPPKNWIGKHAGSKVIFDYIKKFKPRYVFCGHIHEAEGMEKIGGTEVYNLGVAGYKIIEI